ncbi:MAG TPA: MBL fold metallo-hydrolase [Methanomicrobiales archaeon]|nr:MBL fold metallo-hydrolase [Methanomicrobiales archaeon]
MEIIPGVHRVEGMHGNSYLVERDGGLVLIDTGMPGSAGKILSCVRDGLGKEPTAIGTILLTHYHIDHTGSVAKLAAGTKAKVAIHEGDAPYLAGEKQMPVPKVRRSVFFRILRFFVRFTPVRPDIVLRDGDTIAGFTCIHTPGHTPGSACFYDPQKKVIFVGDATVTFGGAIQGPVAEYSADPAQARASLGKIANLDFDTLLSGHGEPVKPGAAAKLREFLGKK